jgi:hypothetical protein
MKTFIFCLLIGAVAFMTGCVSSRQVIVYAFTTDAGRRLTAAAQAKQMRCALGNGGYHEWGGVRAGEKPVNLAFIETLLRDALHINGYEGLRRGDAPDLVIVFHWGCLNPQRGLSLSHGNLVMNEDQMLDLVGAAALLSNPNSILLHSLIEAAAEERYFFIVSAYIPPPTGEAMTQLLWRTQTSVPLAGLTQEEAFPILIAAGALHYGRETVVPEFITLDDERIRAVASR